MTHLASICARPFSNSMHSAHRHIPIASAVIFLACEHAGEIWNDRTHVEQKSSGSSRWHDQQYASDSRCKYKWNSISYTVWHKKKFAAHNKLFIKGKCWWKTIDESLYSTLEPYWISKRSKFSSKLYLYCLFPSPEKKIDYIDSGNVNKETEFKLCNEISLA